MSAIGHAGKIMCPKNILLLLVMNLLFLTAPYVMRIYTSIRIPKGSSI